MINFIDGGICAPKGFRAAGIHCGIRPNKIKKDLTLIVSDVTAAAAAVYTQNIVKGAPIYVTQKNLENSRACAVICNSGIANTCNADGIQKAEDMCKIAADALGCSAEDIIVASTGVIGQPLNLTPIKASIKQIVNELSYSGGEDAAQGIMTTDTIPKSIAVAIEFEDGIVNIGGIAKGSGMMNPNMATMLSFLTTDAEIEPDILQAILKDVADVSFNRVSVDGDTSTNDMLSIMANGKSGVKIILDTPEHKLFVQGLTAVCVALSKLLAKDGEGATKLIECAVNGGPDFTSSAKIADSIINSPLVKTAMFGEDANWGRILCALGYAGVSLDVSLIDVSFRSADGEITVCKNGVGVEFDEEKTLKILKCDEIIIDVQLNQGTGAANAWGCDLSYDYVKINGDYRT